ncbi:MAG: LL-diaminopimelate aminotransferase [Candidatus Methanolliviera hydrocarbonicum]|uniref:Aminotransferase n=1 Tax=Candidatus Methanolliviera hydrocarbonicum TaxID=2491085 RepID=A0A520KW50_9EURY|nr:MAG: LL-diaminopimelate aminotransferase [Candidatus Methanolliviera hydrocarbonicum]
MYSEKLRSLPPYLFASIDELKREKLNAGIDLIDLGVGDPDMPTPSNVIDALCEAARDPKNHRYPSYEGMIEFREAIVEWYKRRFGVSLDPEKEAMTLIGSKEGIAHIPFAFLDEGDVALIPDPAYTVYRIGCILAGGRPVEMPLLEENGFKPDLEMIDEKTRKEAKIIFINYPNNPTAATAEKEFYKEVIDFAAENEIIVCNDNAYSEIYYDGQKPPSFLEVKNAKEVGAEFNSLSKIYNMTGWRIGFLVGNEDIIKGLGMVKANIDSGASNAVQIAGIEALRGDQTCVESNRRTYKERRDSLLKGIEYLGLKADKPKATFYVWARVPEEYDSMKFTKLLLDKAGIVVTPGVGFGRYGEGYVRFSLTEKVERIEEGVRRIEALNL